MLKSRVFTYLIFLILYLTAVSLAGYQLGWKLSFFWLGAFLGFIVYQLYNLFYSSYFSSGQPAFADLKKIIQAKKIAQLENLAIESSLEKKNLPTNSVFFQLGLIIMAFFALSSTDSLIGKGLVMGLFLYTLISQGILLFKGDDINHWFSSLNIQPPRKIQSFYFLILVVIFLLLSFFLI